MRPSPEPAVVEPGTGNHALDLTQLSVGELLLIWALRTRVARGPNGPVTGFRLAFGLAGIERALANFEALFSLLQQRTDGGFAVHDPACRWISPDEIQVMSLLAAFQAGRSGYAHMLASRMVEGAVFGNLIDCAEKFASQMRRHKLDLPLRGWIYLVSDQTRSVH
ncbi:MAG: hypothetical protein AAF637_02110 [Pseudomonadota bacterium]